MPLQVYWIDADKTIIRCDSEGKWTWEEYHAALDQIAAMMRAVSHRVDMINVEGPGSTMPAGSPQPHFARAAKVLPSNVGLNITVVKSTLGRAMGALMGKLPGDLMRGVRMVGTLEEGLALIAKDRAQANPQTVS